MARIVRALLVAAGVGFVLWLVRDRLVSVWSPEASTPAPFRVPPPEHAAPPPELTAIPGIGPVYAERLALAGLGTPADLAAAGPARVAEAARVGEERAAGWIGAVEAP